MKLRLNIILIIILFCSGNALAQSNADDLEVINLEDLYKKEEVKVQVPAPTQVTPAANTLPDGGALATPDSNVVAPLPVDDKPEEISVKELKDLNQLVPFSEISVIQRKFMPKSERLQLFVGAGLATNTPWFTNYGAKVNLSYNFTESFGLEINTLFLTSSERDVAKEIKENHNVEADQFVNTKGYVGLDLVWSPIYGKISYDNTSIINYEMYFSLGGGKSETNSVEKSVTTLHLGVGQIFSLTKSMAFRWDYGATTYQATPVNLAATGAIEKSTYTDLVLTAGFSFFFPEANYR
jgi:outer membrane beta-barrel protein